MIDRPRNKSFGEAIWSAFKDTLHMAGVILGMIIWALVCLMLVNSLGFIGVIIAVLLTLFLTCIIVDYAII